MSSGPDTHDSSVERLTPVVRRLILLRHGQTDFNAQNRMQGQLDTDLSDEGHDQARRAAAALAVRTPRAIWTSDLKRARATADALARATGVPVTVDDRLRETFLGEWQGLTHIDVDAAMPGARRKWRDDASWAPPGGESRVNVAERAVPIIGDLLEVLPDWGSGDAPDAPVILVAHGGVIAAVTASLLGLPQQNWPVFGGLANTGWVQLSGHSFDGEPPVWRLDVWNASAGD